MTHTFVTWNGQMQQQTKQQKIDRKTNGQINHYRLFTQLDRLQKC